MSREKADNEETEASEQESSPPEGWALSNLLRSSTVERRALLGILLLLILYTVYFARGLLLPIFLALLLTALLQPLVQLMRRAKIPDSVSAALILLMLVATLVTATYQIALPASQWLSRRPVLLKQVERRLNALKESLQLAQQTTERIEQIAGFDGGEQETVLVKGPTLVDQVLDYFQSAAATAAVMLVLVYFLLSRGRPTLKRLARGLPEQSQGRQWAAMLVTIQQEIAAYLLTITLINTTLGVVTAAAMALLGLPNPLLWGVMAGVLNFVPYLGALVTALTIAAVSLLTFDVGWRIALPPLVFYGLTVLEGQFVTPLIVGRRLTLNPILIFVSLLFWGWVWGVGGMLLAVPILATLKIVFQQVEAMKQERASGAEV